jgi:GNAT superfamily N-acetyltransferase
MLEQRAAHSRHTATTATAVFDPARASEAQWDDILAYWRLRNEEDIPDEPQPSDAEVRRNVQQERDRPLHDVQRLLAQDEHGRLLGSLNMSYRREGSPDYATFAPFIDVWGGVLRAHRRQGVASQLLHGLLAVMEAQGQTVATLRAHLPEGHAFLHAIGATEKHRSVENRMDFAGLDWAELAHWQAEAFGPAHGLRAEIHVGRVPRDRLATLIEPMSVLLDDAPTSGLERAPLRYELDDYLAWYAEIDRRGGEHFLVLLLDGDGDIAAMCDASFNQLYPDRMFQRLTAVSRRWRGKGLAKGVKAAMLRLVHERHPEVTMATTSNAEVNAPMLAINRQLGFVPYRHDGVYQIGTESLRAFLSTRPLAPQEARP